MIFSSIEFLLWFLPIFLIVYGITPRKYRNLTLLVGSIVFYARGDVRYLPLLMISILCNYFLGLHLAKRSPKTLWRKKLLLILTLGANLAVLLWFKDWGGSAGLPLGISFYTFQTMSYSIDVYRGDVPTEHNLIDFGAYVVMFPQLIAGPIVKYRDVSDRLHVLKGRVTMDRVEEGVYLFILGLAKKVLLADGISALWYDVTGHMVNGVMEYGVGLENASTPLVWLGLLAYTLQIYFDFSGYSLMGIGMGKMLGFDFPDNFNLPYISKSITEFWRRWHMTLSSWFREYVYIPLGGNRKGLARQLVNIAIVWFLTGFWHGANWNFILWGLYYCVLLILEKTLLLPYLKKGKVWPHIYTLLLVMVGWAFFVGSDVGVQLPLLLQRLFVPTGGVSALYFLRNYGLLLAVGIVCASPITLKVDKVLRRHKLLQGIFLAVLLVITIAYMVDATNSPFLYFRF